MTTETVILRPRLKHKQTVPYGGQYTLDLKDRGFVGSGTNFEMLVDRVAAYRKANNLPIGLEFSKELEEAVCRKYPDECVESDPRIPERPRQLSLKDVENGTAVMLAHKLAGSPLESLQVASERAKTCAGCRYNVAFAKPCGGICRALKTIVHNAIGNPPPVPHGDELKACSICHCFLSAAIWVPLEFQCLGVDPAMRSQFKNVRLTYPCWKQC